MQSTYVATCPSGTNDNRLQDNPSGKTNKRAKEQKARSQSLHTTRAHHDEDAADEDAADEGWCKTGRSDAGTLGGHSKIPSGNRFGPNHLDISTTQQTYVLSKI